MFHAFEIATDDGYILQVHRCGTTCDEMLTRILRELNELGVEPDTIAVGTVRAASTEEAVNRIVGGVWEYSQKN